MESSSTITIAVVGVLATCVGGLLWVIKFMFTKMVPSIDGLTKATDNNTKATASADRYLKDRNGRDAIMHKELIKAVGEIPKQIIATAEITSKTLKKAPLKQTVKKQEVEVQTVREVK